MSEDNEMLPEVIDALYDEFDRWLEDLDVQVRADEKGDA